jgi:hypothetical protein
MGSHKCRIVGKSQPVPIMIHPIIFTRTRTRGAGGNRGRGTGPSRHGAPSIEVARAHPGAIAGCSCMMSPVPAVSAASPPASAPSPPPDVLQSKRLLIESRWVSKPLVFAGKLRPRRLNKQPF